MQIKVPIPSVILDKRRQYNSGNYPVKLRITYCGKQKYFKTSFNVSEEDFDFAVFGFGILDRLSHGLLGLARGVIHQRGALDHRGLDLHRSSSLLVVARSNQDYGLTDILFKRVFDIFVWDKISVVYSADFDGHQMELLLIGLADNDLGN